MDNNIPVEISSSINTPQNVVKYGRGHNPNSIVNLKPNRGISPNKKGKTGPKIKPAVDKLLTKERIEKIAERIVANAELGLETKVDTLLKLTGDLNDAAQPTPTITNNTIIGNDVLNEALEYLKQKRIENI